MLSDGGENPQLFERNMASHGDRLVLLNMC
ncbi:Uncharacterised protein [Vibrio cholerae]|nr:Uncharacterised protein [Vibrio cholerae]